MLYPLLFQNLKKKNVTNNSLNEERTTVVTISDSKNASELEHIHLAFSKHYGSMQRYSFNIMQLTLTAKQLPEELH